MRWLLVVLVACKTARPGTREGSPGPFDDLELTVQASQRIDGPLELTATLSREGDECFVAPPQMRIVVDGRPLEMVYAGGASRGQMISGVRVQMTPCNGASFHATGFERRPRSQITVELGNRRAHMTVNNLLVPRVLRVLPSTQLRAGDRVTLEWTPTTDQWSRSGPAEVFLYWPDDFSQHPRAEFDAPNVRFTMPAVRPGPAKVDLYGMGLDAYPEVLGCHGLERCRATARTGPFGVDIVVLP